MAAPIVTSIAPITGPSAGGTIVTVTGTGLTGAIAVGFGPADATNIAVSSDTQVIAVSPAGSGTVNVTVVTPGGRSAINPAAQFAYTGATASSGNTPYYVDPALTSQIVGSLVTLLQSSTSPDAVEAQNILLRRLALEGDVVGSRVQPPKNISEIGCYVNLLTTLKESAILEQTLAGILGVAGPSPPLGWVSNAQPLSMVSLANDRPPGPAQASIPLSFLVRSDFTGAVEAALKAVHATGATLPFSGPPVIALPPGGSGTLPPTDMLFYLGRSLTLATSAALVAPATDPLALLRPAGSSDPLAIAANVLNAGTTPVTPANYDALQCNATSCSTVSLNAASFVPVAPILAAAGFYPAVPLPLPAKLGDTSWARFTNITGLVNGATKLGDELSLLYSPSAIAASSFAAILHYIWNGMAFAAV